MTSDNTREVVRGLRGYSSSALAELTVEDLRDWAGASRQAIDLIETLTADNARLRGAASALVADVRRRYNGDETVWPHLVALDAALKGASE